MREMTEAVFLKDVAKHQMRVLLDQGIYRHLRFKSTEHGFNQWFDIVTWPGYLAYSGDMGCYVFARLEDMFEFFRHSPRPGEEGLFINVDYWAEKLEAVDRCGRGSCDAEEYSEEKFIQHVNEAVQDWINEYDLSPAEQTELRNEIEEQVLSASNDGEHEAHRALRDFTEKIGEHEFEFHDSWEWDLREYSLRFVWCCYALVWAIQQYDQAKQPKKEVADAAV
jgi:hypothetical protein